jgi:hypothetical protein
MKLAMSTTVAAVALTLLATGLAEAQKKDYATVRQECRAEVHHWGGGNTRFHRNDRDNPDERSMARAFNEVRACIQARGYVPRLPPKRIAEYLGR